MSDAKKRSIRALQTGGICGVNVASYIANGRPSFGVVEDDSVIELTSDGQFSTLRESLNHDVELQSLGNGRSHLIRDVEFMPVIPDARKIFCIGINYQDHSDETGKPVPDNPSVFVRFSDSVVGHRQAVVRPAVSKAFDFEGELAVIIGKPGRHIDEPDALSHVAGYSCFAENSLRDYQFHSTQAIPGKSFWRSGGFGPWMVTADSIADPQSLSLTTRLNGDVMQQGETKDMIFSVARLISYISQFTPLSPGDVIATGTPAGVGFSRDPKVYMKPGDTLEVEISEIGTLCHEVVDE